MNRCPSLDEERGDAARTQILQSCRKIDMPRCIACDQPDHHTLRFKGRTFFRRGASTGCVLCSTMLQGKRLTSTSAHVICD